MRPPGIRAALCLALMAPLLASCEREQRSLRTPPPVAAGLNDVRSMANGIGGATPPVLASLGHPYENNAYQINQGKRLYTWFNCRECHADGGGNVGPALMDGWWRYGPDPVSIFTSIRDGRPHGMPSFGDKMTTDQIWQLTGYVRTIGAMSASTAAPSRNDDLQSRPAENRTPAVSAPPPRAGW
jgi:cytochrome c oxidase cbb3-type subunit 3